MKTKILKKLALTCLGLIAFMANAQEPEAEKSTEQIAIDLANPNTTLGTMNFNFDYVNYQGDLPKAGSQNSFVMGFQPILPIPLSNSVNLFVRPQIPLYFTQPTYIPNGFENQAVSFGNISADITIG